MFTSVENSAFTQVAFSVLGSEESTMTDWSLEQGKEQVKGAFFHSFAYLGADAFPSHFLTVY